MKKELIQSDDDLLSFESVCGKDTNPLTEVKGHRKGGVANIVSKWGISFSGELGVSSVFEFLDRVSELCHCYDLEPDDIVVCLPLLLSGLALKWYRLTNRSFISWVDFCKSIKERFTTYDFEHDLKAEIHRRTQGLEEPVDDFVTGLMTLISRLSQPLPLIETVDIVYRNLAPEYKSFIRRSSVYSVADIVDQGRECEFNRRLRKSYVPPPLPSDSLFPETACAQSQIQRTAHPSSISRQEDRAVNRPHSHIVGSIPNATSSANPAPQDQQLPRNPNMYNRIKCWNCDRLGHHFNSCRAPSRVFCHTCGLRDVTHIACPRCASRQGNEHGSPV